MRPRPGLKHHRRADEFDRQRGFTLLELFVASTLLALFVLPMLAMVHKARVRAIEYSLRAEAQELAQRKLFERVYTYSEAALNAGSMEPMYGNFAEENPARANWTWEIPYPRIVSQGEQVLLEYTIRVYAPQLASNEEQRSGGLFSGFAGLFSEFSDYNEPPSLELSIRTLPSAAWYLEQEELMSQGLDMYGGYGGSFDGTGASSYGY